ncbi:hypothetical protein [Helicobacter sp. 23-1045]
MFSLSLKLPRNDKVRADSAFLQNLAQNLAMTKMHEIAESNKSYIC